MKRVINFLIGGMILLSAPFATAQKTNDDRMTRDIAVTENVLSTLIKQEFDQRNFFFMEVKGSYVSGYGVTFTVPTGMFTGSAWGGNAVVVDGNFSGFTTLNLSEDQMQAEEEHEVAKTKEAMAKDKSVKAQKDKNESEKVRQAKENAKIAEMEKREVEEYNRIAPPSGYTNVTTTGGGIYRATSPRRRGNSNSDSLTAVNNLKIIEAAKNFIADYGDMLSQLAPEERIVITNRGNGDNQFIYYGQSTKRSLLSVEATKGDLTQFRQGKITRDQLMAKIKVVNTVTSDKVEPDMELLASIFNRLYRSDLSRTYFLQGNAYYERLTDFGVILHMQVYSSNSNNDPFSRNAEDIKLSMPTVGLENLTQAERDKKVKELYPTFESELKENILDYGRTLKSLKDTEQLMVNVVVTKCKGCGIPAMLEMTVKASVLKDFNAGKLDKNAALSKIEVKKGPNQ